MTRAHKTRVIDDHQARKLRDDVELILESAGEGIYGVDRDGRTTFMNPAAIELLGLSEADVVGTVQHEISHHSHPDGSPYPRETCPIYAAFRDGKSRQVTDEVFWRADGTWFPVEYTSTPIRERGEVVGAVVMFRDVSARRIAEETLRRRTRELEEAQRLAHIGSWQWEIASDQVSWSDELYRIYGLDPQRFPATIDGYLERVHPDDRERVSGAIQQALERRGEFDFEERIVRPDGEVRYLRSRGEVMTDATGEPIRLVGTCQDVTERRDAEARERQLLRERVAHAEAERQSRRLQDLFQQAPAAIAVVRGPDHVFDTVNPRYGAILGGRDVLGKPLAQAFPELSGQGIIEVLDRVYRTGEPYVGTEVAAQVRRTGDNSPGQGYFNFVYQPLRDHDEQVYGIMIHAVEVTEIVRTRKEVERKAAILARTTRALERSNAELDQFAYVASHDLKAPLRGISNLSAWIEEDFAGQLDPDTSRKMELLRNRVQRMENLIDGILEYSRAGRHHYPLEQVDSHALVAETVDLLSPGDRVVIEIAPDMPVLTTAAVPLRQVFQNLLHNAIRHASTGEPRIRVGWRKAGEVYEFSVADDGPGIAPQYQDKIWGIFQTLKARDELEGTGIGLSLVKKIVEARGGEVRVESREGRGATFFFTWPGREVEHEK